MSAIDTKLMRSITVLEERTRRGLEQYARRATWTRAASARWLNERASAVNAAALRHGWLALTDHLGRTRPLPRQPGDLLKIHNTSVFDRLHARLAALPSDDAREAATVPEVCR
jgi:hypothetical protein